MKEYVPLISTCQNKLISHRAILFIISLRRSESHNDEWEREREERGSVEREERVVERKEREGERDG